MLDLFANPGYLAAGGALVSSPIIIHLINRMRFKRLRWAAMEFLLKSQKRNRRRLIIEQIILLMLRCLLVILTALLVLRFVGFSLEGFTNQDSMHVVVVDDTLSQKDVHKEGNERKTAFAAAKHDIFNGIVKSLGQSTTNERLAIIPLSKLVTETDYEPVVYQRLNDATTEEQIRQALDEMQPTNLRVDLIKGVERARKLLGDYASETRPVLHVVSDFRKIDWSGPESDALLKQLREAAEKGVKVRLLDTAHPTRVTGQGGVPLSHDNLALVELRPNARVVGKGVPVTFTVTVANFGTREEMVKVLVHNESDGKERSEIDFTPPMPLKVSPGGRASATFEMRFYPDIKPKDPHHSERIFARIVNQNMVPLENDGLAEDNVRYAGVEVREKVPVLVVDGLGQSGRAENNDSFFIENAIRSVPGGSYEVVWGDELVGGDAVKALERADLRQYPSVFLLNVPELSQKQIANLEKYASEGGGVAFFLGPRVLAGHYNKDLWREGKGVFPAPLKDPFHPRPGAEPLKPAYTGDYQLRVRADQFGGLLEKVPVFGAMFPESKGLDLLKDLPIKRYFQVARDQWRPEPGKGFELATLPNEEPVKDYQRAAMDLLEKFPVKNTEYREYWPALERHAKYIRSVVAPDSPEKAHKLAQALEYVLSDQGKKLNDQKTYDPEWPNLTAFWGAADPKVATLRAQVESLRKSALYGDPFVVGQRFGKGKVVAVMSTAGKEWNDFGGGSQASIIYQPFIWEMQNWLSSQGSEADLAIGTPVEVAADIARLKAMGKDRVKVVRTYFKAKVNEPVAAVAEGPTFGREADGQLVFSFPKTFEPGYYESKLYAQDDANHQSPLAAWGHVFNVDSEKEGKLARVSQEDLYEGLLKYGDTDIKPVGAPQEALVNKQSDLSESPWFFLLFIAILVAEQALAVHLSFHLRHRDAEMPQAARPPAAAAA